MGKKQDLSPPKKGEIKALIQHTNLKSRDIAARLHVSPQSVGRIWKKLDMGVSVKLNDWSKCGRKGATTTRADRILMDLSRNNRKLSSKQLLTRWKDAVPNMSARTVRRRLLEYGYRACRPARKRTLTPAMQKKRLAWARDHKD